MKSKLKESGIESNPVLERLPRHLLQFVKPQDYEHYTPIDQTVWRYVMRKNVDYLQHVAHDSYLDGLKQTGISVDEIPSMYGMNRILQKIGWAAVAVDGLIPTDAFMEFQAYNVLVIASDIRRLEDLEYTPVPDIIHESAGHAPIIANPEYAEFLRRLGQIGCRAISSAKDRILERAVRNLTELKTSGKPDQGAILKAENEVIALQEQQHLSEMTAIRNLHWWSVEYGLIGRPEHYKIYGAGLLSSIGESKGCMSEKVKKIPYTIDAAWQNFDYTKPQPQLFVTPDFAHLSYVIEEFANKMALRKGGKDALDKLIGSERLGTIELSTGLQITGIFSEVIPDERQQIAYFKTSGPTALAYRDRELIGHGVLNYPQGFGSPVGKLKGINLAIEDMYPRDLEAYDIYEGRKVRLEFEGQIVVEGEVITGIRNLQGKILLIRFRNCLVTCRDHILFTPDDGLFNMAVGKEVVSGYAGPADLNSFDLITHHISEKDLLHKKEPDEVRTESAYRQIRDLRQSKSQPDPGIHDLISQMLSEYPKEWLLLLECREVLLDQSGQEELVELLTEHLETLANNWPEKAHLILEGLAFGKISVIR